MNDEFYMNVLDIKSNDLVFIDAKNSDLTDSNLKKIESEIKNEIKSKLGIDVVTMSSNSYSLDVFKFEKGNILVFSLSESIMKSRQTMKKIAIELQNLFGNKVKQLDLKIIFLPDNIELYSVDEKILFQMGLVKKETLKYIIKSIFLHLNVNESDLNSVCDKIDGKFCNIDINEFLYEIISEMTN